MKKLTKHILLSIPLIFCLNCTKTKDDTGKTDKKNDTNINSGNLRNDSLKNVPKKKDTIKETLKNQTKNFDSILMNDFNTLSIKKIPKIWSERYNNLPKNFKNTFISSNELVGKRKTEKLIRGFHWSCNNNEKFNNLGEEISINIGYNDENLTYRSGMVFFYFKYQVLKCTD